ncbi:hypothetical protein Brsp01_41690 [Brucella sp. NBRC 12950]|nr:hypothetical protein Brsp01_41690 [Brucella sp. NBRC 12950]
MHPEKPMMGTGCGKDRIYPAWNAVSLVHSFEKSGHRARADGDVPPSFDIAGAQLTRNNGNRLSRLRVVDNEEFWRQQLAETTVEFDHRYGCGRRLHHNVFIDPFLNGNMRFGFKLKIPFLRIGAKIVSHSAFDVYWMSIVSFNEVAIVAVHGPHEIGKSLSNGSRKATSECGRLLRKFKYEII